MSKKVRFWGPLFVFVERRLSIPGTILVLGRLLLLECNHLTKKFGTFFSGKNSTLILSISISFLLFELWLLRIFVFPGWILSPTFSVQCLKSHYIFWSCSFVEANKSTPSAKRKFMRQSWSPSPKQMPIPFFLLPAWKVIFQGHLQNSVEEQAR